MRLSTTCGRFFSSYSFILVYLSARTAWKDVAARQIRITFQVSKLLARLGTLFCQEHKKRRNVFCPLFSEPFEVW